MKFQENNVKKSRTKNIAVLANLVAEFSTQKKESTCTHCVYDWLYTPPHFYTDFNLIFVSLMCDIIPFDEWQFRHRYIQQRHIFAFSILRTINFLLKWTSGLANWQAAYIQGHRNKLKIKMKWNENIVFAFICINIWLNTTIYILKYDRINNNWLISGYFIINKLNQLYAYYITKDQRKKNKNSKSNNSKMNWISNMKY